MIIRDIKELTPRMQDKVNDFLTDCHSQGVYCYPFETYRSQERQDELYAQGRKTPGPIVTWTKNSRHKQREAVDMAFGGEGKWTWEGDWDKMIRLAQCYGLESLAPKEKAHLQDDGTEYNKMTMEFSESNYKDIRENEVKETVFTSHTGDKPLAEAQVKDVMEIIIERLLTTDKFKDAVKQAIIEELTN